MSPSWHCSDLSDHTDNVRFIPRTDVTSAAGRTSSFFMDNATLASASRILE